MRMKFLLFSFACSCISYVLSVRYGYFVACRLANGFFDLPECAHIKKLFTKGQQGVLIKGKDHRKISGLVKDVVAASGIERLILFLRTLDAIAQTEDVELLSSSGYISSVNTSDTERINVVMNYIMQHYANDIKVEEIASLSNLTVSSFCRYFKSRTNKTFSQLLNEVRVLNACKLLVKNEMTITEICYETGYNNISHFNRQFKLITGLTAKEYAKKYIKNLY